MMRFTVRQAITPAEKRQIYLFRFKVYIEEMGKTHLPADYDKRLMYDEADEHSVLYYVCEGEKILSTVRSQRGVDGPFREKDDIFFDLGRFVKEFGHRTLAVVDRLIVDREFRNGRLAREMMLATYRGGLEVGTRCCFIACEEQLLSLYLRYGFRLYAGEPVLLPSGEKRCRLVLFLRDKAYLEKSKSPFRTHLPGELDDFGEYASKMQNLLVSAETTPTHQELRG